MYIDRLTYRQNLDGTVTLSGPCQVTGQDYSVTVGIVGLTQYINGAHAQTAFPDLPAEQREFLISGTSPEGWTQMFSQDEETTK
jgi:hypothetical protein